MIRIAYIETMEDGTQRSAEVIVLESMVEETLERLREKYPITCIERWS